MKKKSLAIILVPFITLMFFIACGEKKEAGKTETPVTSEEVKKEATEAVETATAYTQQQIQDYQQNITAKLDEYGQKISELKARSEEMTDQAKAEMASKLTDLNAKKQAMDQKLEEIKHASGKSWEDIKSGMDAAMEDFAKAYEEAVSHFK